MTDDDLDQRCTFVIGFVLKCTVALFYNVGILNSAGIILEEANPNHYGDGDDRIVCFLDENEFAELKNYPELGCRSYHSLLITLAVTMIISPIVVVTGLCIMCSEPNCMETRPILTTLCSFNWYISILSSTCSFLFLGIFIEVRKRKSTFEKIFNENEADSIVDWDSFYEVSPGEGCVWFGNIALFCLLCIYVEWRGQRRDSKVAPLQTDLRRRDVNQEIVADIDEIITARGRIQVFDQ